MTVIATKKRLRAHRAMLLASVAFSTVLAVGGASQAFADGGRGGSDFQGLSGGAGGAGGNGASGGDIQNGGGSAGGGGGGSGGGNGGNASLGNGGNGGDGGENGLTVTGVTSNTSNQTGAIGTSGSSALDGSGGGGGGGGAGGYGLNILGSGVSSNSAQVTGGNGGIGGNGVNNNDGSGGAGQGGGGGDGGTGISLGAASGANFTNSGVVLGGNGFGGGNGGTDGGTSGLSGVGGAGVSFVGANGILTNSGAITGGTGGEGNPGAIPLRIQNPPFPLLSALAVPAASPIDGAGGGNGVEFLGAAGNLVNQAGSTVTGGNGGDSFGGVGGTGGIGVYFANGGTLVNKGTITGGTSGSTVFGSGGTGGAGVSGSNLTITNAGAISGGQAGVSDTGKLAFGGVGIQGADLHITNAGTISGGANSDGTIANAIQFTGGVNTLTMTSTSVINGNVVAFSRADTLGLGGDTNGSFNLAQVGPANSAVQYQGFGILQKTGASTWTLAGAPVGTTLAYQVAAGTLDLGGTTQTATSLQMTGGTLANGTLISAGAFDMQAGTVTGNLAGTGALTKTTIGTVILAGTNTYTGDTNVNGGTLEVDGVITASNVIVNNGGALSGIGKIGDPTINAGGTLAPGNAANPYGTLTIVGPLSFAAGSFYNVAITPTLNSRTNVVGTTTIAGGTVNVAAGAGTYQTRQYTILNATGGVTGKFSNSIANTNLAFLTPTLTYDANNVYLNIAPSAPTPQGTPNYRTAAITQNQLAVAGGLTNGGAARPRGDGGRIVTALNQLTAPQARAAFDSLSGEGLTAAQNVANRSTELFTSSIFDQTTFYSSAPSANSVTLFDPSPIHELADLPSRKAQPTMPVVPNRTWRAWATGYGGVDDIHGNGQIGSSYQQNTIYGGTLGVDYQLTPNYLVGAAIGGSNGDFLVPGRATSGSTTGGHVAFYDLATFGSFYGASSTSFSYFGNRATRTVSGFGGLGTETERANFNSNEFRSRLEFGRHYAGYGGVLTPFIALELAELRSNGFTENAVQGAGLFRLNVSGQSQASAPTFVGVRLQRVTSIGNGITLSPTLQVAYVHEFAPYRSQIGTLADLPGSTFLVDGARPARNAAQVKAGAEMSIGARSVIFANFDGEFSGVNQFYAGKGGFRYFW